MHAFSNENALVWKGPPYSSAQYNRRLLNLFYCMGSISDLGGSGIDWVFMFAFHESIFALYGFKRARVGIGYNCLFRRKHERVLNTIGSIGELRSLYTFLRDNGIPIRAVG